MQKFILALALATAPVRHPRATQKFGNASPYNVNPGLKVGAIPFTIGTNDSQCGVTGHTVIVHKGCPANSDDPCDPGVRIGCCVLA